MGKLTLPAHTGSLREALRRWLIFRRQRTGLWMVVFGWGDGRVLGRGEVSRGRFPACGHTTPRAGQAFTVEVEIDQGEVGAQPVMVLGDAAVSHLIEAED